VVNKVKTNYPDRKVTLDFGDLSDSTTRLLADENYLTEALVQIVDNALKFSPLDKTVELSLRQCTALNLILPNLPAKSLVNLKDEVQPWLLLSVRDYGVGIQIEDLENIFEPFYRSKNSPNGPVSGSGLGLPLARKLVELHNGFVCLDSTLAEGTTFYIALPPG
jgi:signal transduction histidine kinase